MEQNRIAKPRSAPVPTGTLLERLDLGIHRLEVRIRDTQNDGVNDTPEVSADRLPDFHHGREA